MFKFITNRVICKSHENTKTTFLFLCFIKKFDKIIENCHNFIMKKDTKKPKFLDSSISKKAVDVFMPTADNDYRPRALHFKSLSAIVIVLILLKIFMVLFLFVVYPSFVYLSTDIYEQIIELTNKTRIEEGVSPLEVNEFLTQAAYKKAQDMLLRQYFAHDTPDGKKPWQWIDKKEYDYTNAGENLAMNFTSAEVAHLALIQSKSHKKNIVNPKFKDIGVAVLIGEMSGKKTMIMVEMFGKQRVKFSQENNKSIKQENSESVSQSEQVEQTQPAFAKNTNGGKDNIAVMGEEIDLSPETNNTVNSLPKEVEVKISRLNFKSNLVNNVLKYFDYFMFCGLGFLVLLLALNIFIKIRVQRPAVILQSMTTVAIIIILIIAKFHFIQQLATKVIIS